jgi:hypothetical protein
MGLLLHYLLLASAAVALTAAAPSATPPRKQWIVDAINGDDAASGESTSTAFRTLERARATLSEWRSEAHPAATATTGGLRVLLRAGEYAPLRLDASDDGDSADSVMTWAAFPGEEHVISAGFRVPASAVHTVSK